MPELDEHGELVPLNADQALDIVAEWAANYPTGRFVVVGMAEDGWDAQVLGWGLAQPDQVQVHLPGTGVTGSFSSAEQVIRLLSHTVDARLIWVDDEPVRWDDDDSPEETAPPPALG
ncbi:MAG: hypothetical protein ACT4N7_03955 [Actinokineospora sp.]